jgi:hypothetical protein
MVGLGQFSAENSKKDSVQYFEPDFFIDKSEKCKIAIKLNLRLFATCFKLSRKRTDWYIA